MGIESNNRAPAQVAQSAFVETQIPQPIEIAPGELRPTQASSDHSRQVIQDGMIDIEGHAVFATLDANGVYLAAYDQLSILDMQISDREFSQVHHTFGTELFEGFKREPRIYNFSLFIPFTDNQIKIDSVAPPGNNVQGSFFGDGLRLFQDLYTRFFRATVIANSLNSSVGPPGPWTFNIYVKQYIFHAAGVSLNWRYASAEPQGIRANLSAYVFDTSIAPEINRNPSSPGLDSPDSVFVTQPGDGITRE